MAVNERHPLYQEYISKCRKLSNKYFAEEDAILAQYPKTRGLDHPAGGELRALALRHNAELKSLQKEYSFLFEHAEKTDKPSPGSVKQLQKVETNRASDEELTLLDILFRDGEGTD